MKITEKRAEKEWRIKHSKYLLLKKKEKLNEKDKEKLEEVKTIVP